MLGGGVGAELVLERFGQVQGQHGVPIGVVPVGGQPILHLHALIQHPVGLEYLQKGLRAQLIDLHRAGLKKIALGVRVVQLDLGLAGGGGGGGITQTYYIAQMIKGLAKKG